MLTIRDLFHAVILDDAQKIAEIIAAGVNIDELYNGSSALHLAVKLKKYKALQQLVTLKANLNAYDGEGYTPLGCAVAADDLEAMGALLHAGAGINTVDKVGRAPIHVAIVKDKINALQQLIGLGADLTLKTKKCSSVLCLAAQKKRLHCAAALLQAGVNPDSRTEVGQSALIVAINEDDLMMVQLLLQHRADINAPNPVTKSTPFMEALLKPADENRKNTLAILNALHKAGAKIKSDDEDDNTPLLILAAENNGAAGITFLSQQGVDVAQKFQDDGGEYDALYAAIDESCVESVKTLTQLCPRIALENYTRHYKLSFAAAESLQGCSAAQLAINREIDRKLDLQNYKLRKDAAQSVIVDKELAIKDAEIISAAIIEQVALCDADYFKTFPPIVLFRALELDISLTTATLLLKHGCSPNIQVGADGLTSFFVAIALKNITVDYVQAFIEHGASLTQTLFDGRTVLHVAILAKKLDVMQLLLKQPQVDVNQANRKGRTPLAMAFEEKCDAEIIDTLLAVSNIDICVTVEKLIAKKAKDVLIKLLTYQNYRLLQVLATSHNVDVMRDTYSLLPSLIREAYETLVKTNLPVALTLLTMSEEFFYDITTDYIRKNRNELLKQIITLLPMPAQSSLLLQVARAKKTELFKLLIAEIKLATVDIACAALQQEKKEKEVILFLLTEDSVFKEVLTKLFLDQAKESLKSLANWQPERLCKLFLELPSLTDQMLVELYEQFTQEKQIILLSKVLENEDAHKLNLLLKQTPGLDLNNKLIGKKIALFAAAHKQQELLKCLQACNVNMCELLLEEQDFALIQELLELVEIDIKILLAICHLGKLEDFLQLEKNISHELLPVLLKKLMDNNDCNSMMVLLKNYFKYIEVNQRKEAMAFIIEKQGRQAVQKLILLANSQHSIEMVMEILVILIIQNRNKILREEINKLNNHDEAVELMLAMSPVMLLNLLEEGLMLSSSTTNKVMDYGVSAENVNLVFKLFNDYADFINIETQRQGLLLLLQKKEVQILSVLCLSERWKMAILQLGKETGNEIILRKLSLVVEEQATCAEIAAFPAKAESSNVTTVEASVADTKNAAEERVIPVVNKPVQRKVSFALCKEEKSTAATLLAQELSMTARGRQVKVTQGPAPLSGKNTFTPIREVSPQQQEASQVIISSTQQQVSVVPTVLVNAAMQQQTYLACVGMLNINYIAEASIYMRDHQLDLMQLLRIACQGHLWRAVENILNCWLSQEKQNVILHLLTDNQQAGIEQLLKSLEPTLLVPAMRWAIQNQTLPLARELLNNRAYLDHACLCFLATQDYLNLWKLHSIQKNALPEYFFSQLAALAAEKNQQLVFTICEIQRKGLIEYVYPQVLAQNNVADFVAIAEEIATEKIMQTIHHEGFLQEAILIAEMLKIVSLQIKLQLCLTEFYLVMEHDRRKAPYYIPLKQYDFASRSLQAVLTILKKHPEACTVAVQEKIALIEAELMQRARIIRKCYLERNVKTFISFVSEMTPTTIHQLIDQAGYLKDAILMAHLSARIDLQIKLQLCLCEFYLAMDKQDIRRLPYQDLQAQCDLTQKYLQDTLELVHLHPELCTAEVMMQVQNIHAGLDEKLKEVVRAHFSTGQFAPTYQSSNIPLWKKPFTFDPTVRTAYISDFSDFIKESKLNWEKAATDKGVDNIASAAPQLG